MGMDVARTQFEVKFKEAERIKRIVAESDRETFPCLLLLMWSVWCRLSRMTGQCGLSRMTGRCGLSRMTGVGSKDWAG